MPIRVQSRKQSSAKPLVSKVSVPQNAGGQPFDLPLPAAGATQLPAGVSLCMIVKNEERYLAQCLKSVAEAVDEINILDTGSTDRTLEIAREFGARIKVAEWRDDFSWARNQALEMATKRWILVLDADEELSADSLAALRSLKNTKASTVGLYLRCENLSDDYKGTGTMSHLLARVFPNHPLIRFISPVHEYITFDGGEGGIETKLSTMRIIHHGYLKDVVAERNKANRNLDLIRRACDDRPHDPFNWYNLGMTAHVVKDYATAISALEKMREILAGAPRGFLPAALVTLAECYAEGTGELDKALAVIQECLIKTPRLPNAHFTLGRILYRMGKREEAREAFEAAIEDEKFSHLQFVIDDQVYKWKAQLSLGVSYADERRWDEAIAWYDRGLANQPGVQPLMLNRCHALEGAERYAEAEAAFRAVYEKYDDEVSAVQLINYLLRRRDMARAMQLMDDAAPKVSPRVAATFFVAAAACAQRVGNGTLELEYLHRAQQCDPAAGPVLDALEEFYRTHNDLAMLERLHATEFDYEPKEPEDFVRRSFRYISAGRIEEALEAAEKGLAIQPLNAKLRYNAAASAVQLNRTQDALRHLRAIPVDAPEMAEESLMLQAMLLRDAGNFDEAQAVAAKLLVRNPGQLDATLLRAVCLENTGRAAEAGEILEAALPSNPQRVSVELGMLYLRHGRFEDAQRVAENALALG